MPLALVEALSQDTTITVGLVLLIAMTAGAAIAAVAIARVRLDLAIKELEDLKAWKQRQDTWSGKVNTHMAMVKRELNLDGTR